jgi:hypothetical protein
VPGRHSQVPGALLRTGDGTRGGSAGTPSPRVRHSPTPEACVDRSADSLTDVRVRSLWVLGAAFASAVES